MAMVQRRQVTVSQTRVLLSVTIRPTEALRSQVLEHQAVGTQMGALASGTGQTAMEGLELEMAMAMLPKIRVHGVDLRQHQLLTHHMLSQQIHQQQVVTEQTKVLSRCINLHRPSSKWMHQALFSSRVLKHSVTMTGKQR